MNWIGLEPIFDTETSGRPGIRNNLVLALRWHKTIGKRMHSMRVYVWEPARIRYIDPIIRALRIFKKPLATKCSQLTVSIHTHLIMHIARACACARVMRYGVVYVRHACAMCDLLWAICVGLSLFVCVCVCVPCLTSELVAVVRWRDISRPKWGARACVAYNLSGSVHVRRNSVRPAAPQRTRYSMHILISSFLFLLCRASISLSQHLLLAANRYKLVCERARVCVSASQEIEMSAGANRFRALFVRLPERRPLEWLCARHISLSWRFHRWSACALYDVRTTVGGGGLFGKCRHSRIIAEAGGGKIWSGRGRQRVLEICIGMYQLPVWGGIECEIDLIASVIVGVCRCEK